MHSAKPNTPASWVSSMNVAKAFGSHRIDWQLMVGSGQQMRLADTETTVEVQPDTGQHLSPAEQLLAAGAAARPPAEQNCWHAATAADCVGSAGSG